MTVAWMRVGNPGSESNPEKHNTHKECIYSYKRGIEPEGIHFFKAFLQGFEFKYVLLFECFTSQCHMARN